MTPSRALVLFSRLPEAGKVKTRLLPRYSPQEALQLHLSLLSDSLDLLNRAAARRGASAWLYLSEAGTLDPDLDARRGTAEVVVQRGVDLGERLARAFQERLAGGARQVVIFGSDSPLVPEEHIGRAFAALERSDLVLGPAEDGGYYLIGAGHLHLSLFRKMPWGGEKLFAETMRRARAGNLRVESLPAAYDVDTPESVARLWADLLSLEQRGGRELPASTRRLLRRWLREGKVLE
jgi:hypothetical protein